MNLTPEQIKIKEWGEKFNKQQVKRKPFAENLIEEMTGRENEN